MGECCNGDKPDSTKSCLFICPTSIRLPFPIQCACEESNWNETIMFTPFARCDSQGSNPRRADTSLTFVRDGMRGTGFEPADSYETAS